jgi:predicted dehydrogenase/threonine dehydrogenase-like Zn-dependent dehydrogenase
MRQVLVRGGKVEVAEVPAPAPDPHRALVATAYSVISAGTEGAALAVSGRSSFDRMIRHPSPLQRAVEVIRSEGLPGILRRVGALSSPPEAMEMGYSACGVIVERGEGVQIPVGTPVACAGAQYAHHAEIISVPANLLAPVPGGVRMEDAAFATLGAIALHGFRRGGAGVGETVGVVGLGLVGMLGAQIARAAGCRVLAFDRSAGRAALARELGIGNARGLEECDPVGESLGETAGRGLDVVLVFAASSTSEPLDLAMQLARKKGKVVIVGDVRLEADRALLYAKELDLLISTSYGPGRYDPAYEEGGRDYPFPYVRWTEGRNLACVLEMMASGRLQAAPLIDRIWPVQQASAAYESLAAPASRPAVLLSYPVRAEPPGPEERTIPLGPATKSASEIGVAVVGPGGFMKEVFVPALRRRSGVRILGVVSGTGGGARLAADRFGAAYASTDLEAVLRDPAISLVVIGTRHHLHAEQVIRSLQAGKSVFVEKPLCLSRAELEQIRDIRRSSRGLLAVGFNRRYAPFVRRIKEMIARLPGPIMIEVRVNALRLSADHWTRDPAVGGGRLAGEGCHFLDLIPFLAGSGIAALQAESLPAEEGASSSDNFALCVRMKNGSLGSLFYTSLGDASLPKERVEVHAAGTSLVLDDYRDLSIHAGGKARRMTRSRDKGIEAETEALVGALRGQSSPLIAWEEIDAATEWTLRAREMLESPS